MTLSAAFSAGAAFAMLFVAFVVGALLVIAAVVVPVIAVVTTVLWLSSAIRAGIRNKKGLTGATNRKTPQQELDSMKDYVKRIKNDKAMSLDLLVAAGILTKDGKLTEPYRSE